MATTPRERTTLRRSLSVWQAVGISVALMAPSMAANINPQGTASQVGRATPLAFFLAAVAVLLIAYVFVRLCQHYRHAGSVYVFAGATLGARAGAVAGFGLMGTYVFYALVTSSAAGIFGSAFLDSLGIWTNQPDWAGFLVGGIALVLALFLAVVPARRAGAVLLSVEGATVTLILVIAVVVLVRMLSGSAPNGATFTLTVFTVEPGPTCPPCSSASSSGSCRSPGSRPPRRWARRRGTRAVTSPGRFSGPRSSGASTSPSSPPSR
jgi:amino acid transporter